MADTPYREMTDAELRDSLSKWESNVEKASGWASAYFAAKQVEAICKEGNRRGILLINRFPIRHG